MGVAYRFYTYTLTFTSKNRYKVNLNRHCKNTQVTKPRVLHLIFMALYLLPSFFITSCQQVKKSSTPTIGFLDAFVDETINQAKIGYFKALEDSGYSEKKKTITILYRNAQGDIPTLTQACDFFISKHVDVIASNTTLSTITAIQKTSTIPVCMMVSPSPKNALLTDSQDHPPSNLFGVYETLAYIDTSVLLIKQFFPQAKHLGVIYNQAEQQSVNALQQIQTACKRLSIQLSVVSVSNSSETQLAIQSLIAKNVDCFFAMPDNSVFASFEVIALACKHRNIPVFTSEAGLVKRGALCAFGADLYAWGYQAGLQTVAFLKSNKTQLPPSALVKKRVRIVNERVAQTLGLSTIGSNFIRL